ncbi:MAG: hypothetical protein VZR10_09955, partial [Methanobrevibacter sp.]|nr:hypothetical protein [Methanobrevibacter sp.]
SQEISVSENNFSVSEGNTSINFTYNDNKINLTQKLGLGNHTLIIAYRGNDIYAASNTTITLSIFGNKTMNVPENVSVNDTKTVEIPIEVTNGVNATSLDSTNTNVTLFYKDGEGNYQNKSIELNEGQIIFTEENSLVSAYVTINYYDEETNITKMVNIAVQTNITVSGGRFKDDKDISLPITIKDIYGSDVANESNITVYEGNKSIGFTYADGKITLSEALSAGNHTLTIAYKGSHDYADSSADVDISIIGDWRIELQDLTAIDENNNATLTINITNSVDYLEVAVGELSLNLTYVNASGDINTVTINDFIISGNVIEFNVPSDFTSGNLTVVYNETSNNLLANATVKTGTIITSENVTSLANDTFSFKINVTDIHGNEITISLDDLEVLCDGKALSKATYNESVITVNDQINTGIHNITLKYKGDDTYFASEKIIVLTMFEIVTPSSIDVNSTKIAILPVNVTDGNTTYELGAENLTVTVSYLDENNETKTVTPSNFIVENNTATFTLDDNNFTSGNLTICYNGIYNKTITLNNIINVIISPINTTGYYQSGNLTFKVTDADTGNILTNKSVQIQYKYENIRLGLSSFTTDEKGMIYFNLNKGYSMMGYFLGSNYLTVGVHELIFIGEGQLKGENNTNITISKANVIIIADKFTRDYGTTDKFKITVV